MNRGPQVQRALTFDESDWARLQELALRLGISPEDAIRSLVARAEVNSDGRLEARAR